MGRSLIGHHVGDDASPQQFWEHVTGVTDEADGVSFAPGAVLFE